MAAVPNPSVPHPAAGALVRRVAALRRRDRRAAAAAVARATTVLAAPVLLVIALIHRHLAPLGTPLLALAIAAAVVAVATAVAALRPRSLAATATRHDRLGPADQLLPAALDAALGRRPVDPAVGRLLVRQALEAAQPSRAASNPARPGLPLFVGLTAWLAAALLLSTPGHSVPAPTPAPVTVSPSVNPGDPGRPPLARGPATITRSALPPATQPEEAPGPGPAAPRRVESGTAPTAPTASASGPGGGGLRRGTGIGPGDAAAGDPGGAEPLSIRWQALQVAGAGIAVSAHGSGGAGPSATDSRPAFHAPGAPASTPPARLLSPAQRLVVTAFTRGETTP